MSHFDPSAWAPLETAELPAATIDRSAGPMAPRRLQLEDLLSTPPPPGPPPAPPPPATADLLFDEVELARACAAAATFTATALDEAQRARAVALETRSREELARAVRELSRALSGRERAVGDRVRTLVSAALEALLPSLREGRLAVTLERVLEQLVAERTAGPTLIVEVPRADLEALAPRIPSLLAEAGFEGAVEIRALDEGETIRAVAGDLWAELDAREWAEAVREQIEALVDTPGFAPVDQRESEDERGG